VTLSHNAVNYTGYSGMSVGWGWGTVQPAGYGNVTVDGNRLQHVMMYLRDGGAVYVNGHQAAPSTLTNNWADADEAEFAVWYLDNGASSWTVSNNVASSSPLAWAAFMQGCCNLPAANSTTTYLWYQSTLAPVNNCAAEGCTLDTATVFPIPAGQPWPPAAQAIIDASGPVGV